MALQGWTGTGATAMLGERFLKRRDRLQIIFAPESQM
jgi:hypothetical protein